MGNVNSAYVKRGVKCKVLSSLDEGGWLPINPSLQSGDAVYEIDHTYAHSANAVDADGNITYVSTNAGEPTIITFAAPVHVRITPTTYQGSFVWHDLACELITNGSDWALTPGAINRVTVTGQSAKGNGNNIRSNEDWGELISEEVTELRLIASGADAVRVEIIPYDIKEVCDVIAEMQAEIEANAVPEQVFESTSNALFPFATTFESNLGGSVTVTPLQFIPTATGYNVRDTLSGAIIGTIVFPIPVSVVNSIDLKAGTNANEFVVEITYTDDNGVQQTVTDATPITIPSGPWNNPDGTPATEGSTHLTFREQGVSVGRQSNAGTTMTLSPLHNNDNNNIRIETYFPPNTVYNAGDLGTGEKIVAGLDFDWYSDTVRQGIARANGGTLTHYVFNFSGQDVLRMAKSGQLELPTYGTGTHTGTPTFALSVDTNGKVIETPRTTVEVETARVAVSSVPAQDVNDNGVITTTEQRADTGWTVTDANGNHAYTGTPDRVRITAQVSQSIAQNANIQRPAPLLALQKLIGGTWTTIAESATGYIRDASDHEQSSNTITHTDPAPGTDPTYRLLSEQETANGGVVTAEFGNFALEAVERVEVLAP